MVNIPSNYMIRIILLFIALVSSKQVFASNQIQALYQSVNSGVVELHVTSIAAPQKGQVSYKATSSGSLGSGALIDNNGRILTAAHVVERATEIKVNFYDGSSTSGHVVWIEPLLDLAMIQAIDVPSSIKPLTLAKHNDYKIGEKVMVIGAPYGVSHSLSVGYLSGIRDKEKIPGTDFTPRLLQTDAAINVGNSGGPLFNLKGEIIGIVSHILSQTGGNNGLGFVVSVDTVHDVISSDPGTFSGFIPFLLNKKLAVALNNPHGYGLLIQQIIPGTLADKLGFKGGYLNVQIGQKSLLLGGDILLEVNGYPLKSLEEIIKVKKRIASYNKGDTVSFLFMRDGIKKETSWVVE